jgi:hypothetical protein
VYSSPLFLELAKIFLEVAWVRKNIVLTWNHSYYISPLCYVPNCLFFLLDIVFNDDWDNTKFNFLVNKVLGTLNRQNKYIPFISLYLFILCSFFFLSVQLRTITFMIFLLFSSIYRLLEINTILLSSISKILKQVNYKHNNAHRKPLTVVIIIINNNNNKT